MLMIYGWPQEDIDEIPIVALLCKQNVAEAF